VREERGEESRPIRLAYQPPASSTFLSEQISSTFLSEQISTSTSNQPNEQAVCLDSIAHDPSTLMKLHWWLCPIPEDFLQYLRILGAVYRSRSDGLKIGGTC
jgi:hypothetical protein